MGVSFKRKILFIFVLHLFSGCEINCLPELSGTWTESNETEFPIKFSFLDGKVTEESFDPTVGFRTIRIYNYKLTYTSGVPFIEFGNTKAIILDYSKKAILLKGKVSGVRLFRDPRNGNVFDREFELTSFKASSELREGSIHYSIEGLWTGNNVWASGNGYGINDKISFSVIGKLKALYLGNGYLSFDQPNLYYENSRVKYVKIMNIKTKKDKYVNVLDTFQPQKIEIFDLLDTSKNKNDLEIQILDVYPGSKYKDLCLWELRKDEIKY